MTYTDEKVDLIINKLTRAQYESLRESGEIDENQLYIITDDPSMTEIVRPLRDKGDLLVYSAQAGSWNLPQGVIAISEATKTDGKFIFIAAGTFGTAYSKEEYDTAEQRSCASSATFTINGSDVVVSRPMDYSPTGDTIAKSSDLSSYVKLSSDTDQDISSNLNIDGYVKIGNLEVQGSSITPEWGNIEGNIEDQEDLIKVNYPLDNPTQSSEVVSGVTYKRFDIKDHTIATITLSDSAPVRIHFPSKPQENFCRDFIVKIKVTSSTVPQVQFVKGDNDTSIGFEYEDDSWTELEVGINYFAFTETERN